LRRDEPRAIEIVHAHEHDHSDPGHTHSHDLPAGKSVVTAQHVHSHRHVIVQPVDPFGSYGARTAFVVGMVHGVGAETPTQLLLLVTAAGLTGGTGALVLLAAFVGGLFVANTAVALGASLGFAEGRRLPTVYVVLAFATAVVSVWVGLAYTFDAPQLLPPGLAP
jgi:high-affinity nickel-transport protein